MEHSERENFFKKDLQELKKEYPDKEKLIEKLNIAEKECRGNAELGKNRDGIVKAVDIAKAFNIQAKRESLEKELEGKRFEKTISLTHKSLYWTKLLVIATIIGIFVSSGLVIWSNLITQQKFELEKPNFVPTNNNCPNEIIATIFVPDKNVFFSLDLNLINMGILPGTVNLITDINIGVCKFAGCLPNEQYSRMSGQEISFNPIIELPLDINSFTFSQFIVNYVTDKQYQIRKCECHLNEKLYQLNIKDNKVIFECKKS